MTIDTSTAAVTINVILAQSLPTPSLSRLIWQPVTENMHQPNENTAMCLAPLSWQPSAAHHALEYLAFERDAALARERALRHDIQVAIDAWQTELNLGNYTHDQVCNLQTEVFAIWSVLTSALAKEETKPLTETPDIIDWTHVAQQYKWMARDRNGDTFLFCEKPNLGPWRWEVSSDDDVLISRVFVFASYRRGTCDWCDSRVQRPEGV